MNLNLIKNSYFKLIIIILLSLVIDNIFISSIKYPPPWDQGYHLSNAFKMHNILENNNFNLIDKVDALLNVTDSYRGPITYFFSALFLKIFKNTYNYAYLSNQIFNVICIFSIYNLGKILKDESTGIWASFIFVFSSFIINQRTDYLIDFSLTSFSALNIFLFTKWYLNHKRKLLYPFLSGISLGLIFLTKPTGITIFFLPLLIILIKTLKSNRSYILKTFQIATFIFIFSLTIFPWFSRHWLTIITSTINAWNWGINYQEGFNTFSLESWTYYFRIIPKVFGLLNFSIFSVIILLEMISKNFFYKIGELKINKIKLWLVLYILNCYSIFSLMSTKDIRFILPMYPILCIFISEFINDKNHNKLSIFKKKLIISLSIVISLLTSNNIFIMNKLNRNIAYNWPHTEIIKEIKKENPNLTTTLAVLPDTKEINTFNLEAEAARQDEYVAVRQVVSNKETYKEDLKYFDWFLLKTGDQGTMTSESKDLLSKYLLENKSFIIHKKWNLPDESQLMLLRRKTLNSILVKKVCDSNYQSIEVSQINNGINIYFIGDGKSIKTSNLMIDFFGKEFNKSINISLANGNLHKSFDEKSCYALSQNVALDLSDSNSNFLSTKVRLLSKEGEAKFLNIIKSQISLEDKYINNYYLQMNNRISQVKDLGNFLRKGEFDNLFDLVGVINQSDPEQSYLRNAELIYKQRFKEDNNLEDLYSLLISQILQRKVKEAEKTSSLIIKSDNINGNAYLVNAIINVYLLNSKDARLSINKTKILDKSIESTNILNIVEGLTYLLELKFFNVYKVFV